MLGLYIHIPFCLTKCPYCDFNSYARSTLAIRDEYVRWLCREIETRLRAAADGREVSTIFMGGGTPSLLEAEQVDRILRTCAANSSFTSDVEITIEANPGTIIHAEAGAVEASLEKLRGFRLAGVNRISFGVQSLDDNLLKTLGRLHNAREAVEAYHIARRAGFDNINLDFIFAIPGQTMQQWQSTLLTAVELAPEHLSCYCLTIEEGTPFHEWHRQGRLRTHTEDVEAAMFEWTRSYLQSAGYDAYEISNFAKTGRRCRHNQIYWNDEDYLGVGAGAHSSLAGVRSWNEKNPKRYCNLIEEKGVATIGSERLSGREKLGEAIMLGLRLSDGVNLERLRDRYAAEPECFFSDELQTLTRQGLVELEESHLRLSQKGLLVANSVMAEFIG